MDEIAIFADGRSMRLPDHRFPNGDIFIVHPDNFHQRNHTIERKSYKRINRKGRQGIFILTVVVIITFTLLISTAILLIILRDSDESDSPSATFNGQNVSLNDDNCPGGNFVESKVTLSNLPSIPGVGNLTNCKETCLKKSFADCPAIQFYDDTCYVFNVNTTRLYLDDIDCDIASTETLYRRKLPSSCQLPDDILPGWRHESVSIIGGEVLPVPVQVQMTQYCCALMCKFDSSCCAVDFDLVSKEIGGVCYKHGFDLRLTYKDVCSIAKVNVTTIHMGKPHRDNPCGDAYEDCFHIIHNL